MVFYINTISIRCLFLSAHFLLAVFVGINDFRPDQESMMESQAWLRVSKTWFFRRKT